MVAVEKAVFQYLNWDDLFLREKPFEIVIDIPEDAPDQRQTNCTFSNGPEETVESVRDRTDEFHLDTHGFTFVQHKSELADSEWKNKERVEAIYLKECEDILKTNLDGVDRVHFYNWLVRDSETLQRQGESMNLNDPLAGIGPARVVHIDQNKVSAVQRVLNELSSEAPKLLQGRLRLINLWRPLNGPVESWPLALCDGRTISPSSLIPTERIRRRYTGGTTYILSEAGHKWYFMNQQENDEVAIFKNFDSDSTVTQHAPHCSFKVQNQASFPRKRESIEVRAMVFTYPRQAEE